MLELVYDSLIDSEITVETSEGPVRLLEFRGADATVELALAPVGDRCDVVGRIDPPGVRSAQVHTPTVVLAAVIDDEGGFVATGVPHGPMSVRLFLAEAPQRVHTTGSPFCSDSSARSAFHRRRSQAPRSASSSCRSVISARRARPLS